MTYVILKMCFSFDAADHSFPFSCRITIIKRTKQRYILPCILCSIDSDRLKWMMAHFLEKCLNKVLADGRFAGLFFLQLGRCGRNTKEWISENWLLWIGYWNVLEVGGLVWLTWDQGGCGLLMQIGPGSGSQVIWQVFIAEKCISSDVDRNSPTCLLAT